MSAVQPAGFAALQILQQSQLTHARKEAAAGPAGDLVATANGIQPTNSDAVGASEVDDRFSVTSLDANKLKVHFMERAGEALGLSFDDFESAPEFGRALKDAISALKLENKEDWQLLIEEIEHSTGLDELGISLESFAEAIIDPAGYQGERLEALLRRETGEDPASRPGLDDIGRYGQ